MKNFKDFKTITEAVKLTPAELNKPNSITKEPRIDILIRLIQQNKPIELAKGGSVTVESTPELIQLLKDFKNNDSSKKAAIPFMGIDGKNYTTSDLGKSSVFGGGGGSGGGSLNTKITESHQCVMCQAMLDHGMHDEEFFTPEILTAAYKKVFVDAKLDEVLSVEGDWFSSSHLSAYELIKRKYIHRNMTFHRNDKEMNKIYALKNLAYKNSDLPALKDDKWNPGDIWAIDKSFNMKVLKVDSIKSLNESLLEAFANRTLMGISLKLVKKTAKIAEYNVKLPPDTDDHKLTKILFQGEKRGDFWSNKGATVFYDDGKMALKDNSPGSNVKAEIVLKTARGGGASWGVMQDATQQVFRKKLPNHKSGIYAIAKKIATKKDKKGIGIFWTLYNHFYKNDTYEDFEKNLLSNDTNWISSKLGCLYVCYYVSINTGPKANRWITKIVNYAGSKAEDSSAYVKVYT
jgi:hypothetical protein